MMPAFGRVCNVTCFATCLGLGFFSFSKRPYLLIVAYGNRLDDGLSLPFCLIPKFLTGQNDLFLFLVLPHWILSVRSSASGLSL
jgi:hypothetical protein